MSPAWSYLPFLITPVSKNITICYKFKKHFYTKRKYETSFDEIDISISSLFLNTLANQMHFNFWYVICTLQVHYVCLKQTRQVILSQPIF